MQINPRTLEAYQLLHDGTLALARAEQQGIRVDMEYVKNKKNELIERIEELESAFKSTMLYKEWREKSKGEPNIHSNSQLAAFLYRIKKIEPQKTTYSGQGATDEEALQQLNMVELHNLIEIRKLKKIKDTYLSAFEREQVGGYIHPFFNLHLVRTYRSSSDSPNFQNIPKRDEEAMQIVRQALYPRPGHQLIEVDYSGLEVRIAACYHKDTTMLRYINNPASDMHRDMAQQIFLLDSFDKTKHNVLRQAAKGGFVFAQFYGDYYVNCAINLACNWGKLPQGRWHVGQGIEINGGYLADHFIKKGIGSYRAFEGHIKRIEEDFWSRRFPEYQAWKERWYNIYKKYGYIDTYTGFRCHGLMSRNDSINYPVQGAAFHCLLWSFVQLDKELREGHFDTKLIGQIHDSMILDVAPEELERVSELINQITCIDLPKAWKWIIVPLDIDIDLYKVDGSWATKMGH